MNARVFWKLLVTALLLTYAVFALTPLTTREFSGFASGHVSADKPGFDALLVKARERVDNYAKAASGEKLAADAPKSPTIYQAIRDIANDPAAPVDLHEKFFPKLDLVSEPNLQKRNLIVLRHLLKKSQGKLKLGLDLQGGVAFTLKVPDEAFVGKDRAAQMDKAAKVMQDRINQYGVAEPLIRTVGTNTLEIQLPGEDMANNPDAIDALKKPAKLEFRMVHRFERPKPGAAEFSTAALRENPGDIASPVNTYEVLYERRTNRVTGDVTEVPYYVTKASVATGNIIKHARGRDDDSGLKWHTSIEFNDKGEKIFGEMTGKIADDNNRFERAGQPQFSHGLMAIVLDGRLVQATGLRREQNQPYRAITGGGAMIEAENQQQAWELAGVLNNPLEFPMELEDMQTVGPSLAKDAQTKSVVAASVGVGLVVLFMVAFYLSAGVLSVIAVIVNIVITLGVLAAIGGTITLPGVAALVLTVGMAVDMNILVFERMREESKAGANLKRAVAAGYSRALATILDANITTLLTAAILIWMGTGPIRGFGVTLAIGIVTTVFTALITTRGLQELCVNAGVFHRVFGLSILKKEPNVQFLDYTRRGFLVAGAIMLLGLVAIVVRGRDTLGKDFKGGEAVTVEVAQGKKLDTGEIEKTAKASGVKDVTPLYIEEIGGKKTSLRIECELSAKDSGDFVNATKIVKALVAAHPDYFPKDKAPERLISGREAIGASVSESLQWNALISVALALLGIGVYVALRFESGFGLGAIVATLHDVLMTVGLYVAYGWFFGGGQATAAMVASILMIIGYSINDTIIVFDRVREEMEANPGATLRECIHFAINRTLSRTILTSLTVFLTAVALFVFGAGDVKEYGLVFCIGVLTGVYSSMFIACPVFYWFHKGDRKSVEKAETSEKREWETNPVIPKTETAKL